MEWLDCTKFMPKAGKLYWITDGENIALADWSIPNMWWRFLYHSTVFKAKFMCPVIIPTIPTELKETTHEH